MERKTVKTQFEVTTTNAGKIFANVGDIITISNRDVEHYNIINVNDTKIFSRWMRKACINTNRNCILIEKEQKYFDIINERIDKHNLQREGEFSFENQS